MSYLLTPFEAARQDAHRAAERYMSGCKAEGSVTRDRSTGRNLYPLNGSMCDARQINRYFYETEMEKAREAALAWEERRKC